MAMQRLTTQMISAARRHIDFLKVVILSVPKYDGAIAPKEPPNNIKESIEPFQLLLPYNSSYIDTS